MTTTKKTKLCWNCEGVVDRSAENCIYCGVYLHPEEEDLEENEEEYHEASPPYQSHISQDEGKKEGDYAPIYEFEDEKEAIEELESKKVFKGSEDIRGVILPLVFLLAGSIFLLFSFVLYFFSNNGVFVLKWNANYWFIYLFISIPLLYIGWRTLQYFEERGS